MLMMLFTNELPVEFPTPTQTPCLSLYQPTHRRHPENKQDSIRYKNLLKKLEDSLRQKYPNREVGTLLEPFRDLEGQFEFWNHTLDGLAVLGAPDLFRIYKVQRELPEIAIVADTFHTKPLLRTIQSADRYQVLGLSRGSIKLYEGNRDVLDEIDLEPQVPRTIEVVVREDARGPQQTVASLGGAGGAARYHGHGESKDQSDIDAIRFFRAVDRSILEHHSRPSGLPLILAALPEHHNMFRSISRNPFLLEQGLDIHPDAITIDELRSRVWQIVEPKYQVRLAKLVDEFNQAKPRGAASDQLDQVSSATVHGRVKTLLIEAERMIPGRIDEVTGDIELGDLSHPEIDDLLDDIGEAALKMGGRVAVIPAERMPTQTGVAAVYRY